MNKKTEIDYAYDFIEGAEEKLLEFEEKAIEVEQIIKTALEMIQESRLQLNNVINNK